MFYCNSIAYPIFTGTNPDLVPLTELEFSVHGFRARTTLRQFEEKTGACSVKICPSEATISSV